MELGRCRTQCYVAGIHTKQCQPFCSCDLDFDPMIFVYELGPYFLDIHRMYRYKLPALSLSKVIVDIHTYKHTVHTHRQTDTTEIRPRPI